MAEPLTPSDCDLRDFGYMPLDVRRLRDSNTATAENPEEFRAAVLLWCAAWHQIPAGSLPDNDRELANLAGFGRFVAEWLKVRDGALRGFVRCDDGRIYHRVVCEKALESWIERLQHRRRSAIGNAKRNNTEADVSSFDAAIADAQARLSSLNCTTLHCFSSDSPQGDDKEPSALLDASQGKGREGKGIKEEGAKAPLSPEGDAGSVREAFEAWNETAKRCGLPVARELTDDRRRKIRNRLNGRGIGLWRDALAAVERSPHCRGENDRGWRADLDFVCQPKSFNRLVEGAYEPKASATGPPVVVTDEWLAARTPARKTA